jgi:hypothetical protein
VIQKIQSYCIRHWDALLAAIAACVSIYFLTAYSGIGLSPDSIAYSSAAINLKKGLGLLDYNQLPLVDFPAGYPLFLAGLSMISGLTPIALAPVLNAGLFVVLILLTSEILHGMEGITRIYRAAIFLVLACSPCLWEVYGMLWSETLFLVFVLVFILQWKRYMQAHDYTNLLVLAIIVGLAFLTRIAGISLLATGFALILFDGQINGIKKIKQLSLFSLIGIVPLAINLYRNHLVTGTAAGVRQKALRSLGQNFLDSGWVLGTWLPFIGENGFAGAMVLVALLLLVIALLLFRVFQQQYYHRTSTAVMASFLVYAIFILGISSLSRFETLSSRLLSPMYLPLLLTILYFVAALIGKTKGIFKYGTIGAVLLVLGFGLKNQYVLNAFNWEGIKDAGIPGYSETQWTGSPMVAYISQHKDSVTGAIYADAPGGLYHLTGIKSLPLPHKEIRKEQDEMFSHKNLIVVWFYDGVNDDLIDIPFIEQHAQLMEQKEFEDGIIYYFKSGLNSR